MKTEYGTNARRTVAVAICALLALFAGRTQAALVTVTNGNSEAVYDSVSGGLTQWTVDGVQNLGFEGLWIGLPGQAESQLAVASVTPLGPNRFLASYAYASGPVSLRVDLTGVLTGGIPGSGVSGLTEMITVTSPTAASVRLLQFCDFGALPGLEMVEIANDNSLIELTSAHDGEVAATPGASHQQIGPAVDLLAGLNDGAMTVLTDNVGPVIGEDLAWVYQWDLELVADEVAMISRPKVIGPALTTIIPEPCTMSVMALASAALLARRRRKA